MKSKMIRQIGRIVLQSFVFAAATHLVSCTDGGFGDIAAYQSYDRPAILPKNPDQVRVKVSLSRQRVYVMEGKEMLMVMPVSVGKSQSATPSGNFRINSKKADYRANTHGYAYQGSSVRSLFLKDLPRGWSFKGTPMPYWCEFHDGRYGFHTGWVKHQPCTHGCIRMHENLAPKFFRMVKIGTPVNIARTQPEDAQYADIPLPPDAGPMNDYNSSMYIGDGYFSRHKKPVFSGQ